MRDINPSLRAYRREGALSQYLAELEVLRFLLARLRHLSHLLRTEAGALAAGRRSDSTGLRGRALHAGTVAAA